MTDLPSGWYSTTVGDAAEFLTGYPFPSASFSPTGVRLVRGSNVKRGSLDWGSDIARYWPHEEPALRRYSLSDGDVVVAMDGALVGRSYARIATDNLPAYLVQRVARLRGTAVDQGLLYAWMGSGRFVLHVDQVKTHTAIPHISPRDICSFRLDLPVRRVEQTAIATAIADADDLIASLQRLILKKRAIKQGMMQRLLTGKTRLPEFHAPWSTEQSLADVSQRITGFWGAGTPSKTNAVPVRVIRAGDISSTGQLTDFATRYFTAAEFKKAACTFEDVVITTSGNGLGKTYLVRTGDGLVASNFVRILRPGPGLSGAYLGQVLRTREAAEMLVTHTATSAYPNLMPSFFSTKWMHLPQLPEQQAIAEVLGDVDAGIRLLDQRLTKARLVKQGMMQQLLTGRIRLPVEETAA